jgi:hypothetical protein
MLYTLQKFAFSIAVSTKNFDDDPLLPPGTKANCKVPEAILYLIDFICSLVPLCHHLRGDLLLRAGHLPAAAEQERLAKDSLPSIAPL